MNWHLKSYGLLSDVVGALVDTLSPFCDRLSPIGLLPRRSGGPSEIRLLAVLKHETVVKEKDLKLLQNQEGIRHLGGERYQFEFKGVIYPFQLMRSSSEAWYARMVQVSSYPDVHISIATAAKNMGMKWQPARGGFEILETGEMRLVGSEEEVFEVVKMPYIPPEKRHLWPEFALKESGLPPIITQQQMRDWAKSVPWTDTWCGGEHHQYTFRTSGDERAFVHLVECIRELGYDGMYLRKKWRYLDLDGQCYFSYGSTIETTTIINRKKLRQAETPWAKNEKPWIPQRQKLEGDDR
jgi:hypothetical protein